MSDDQPKCPVDQKTRDVWIQKSKQSQAAQQTKFDTAIKSQSQLTQPSWSFRNLLWATPKAVDACPVDHSRISDPAAVCPVPKAGETTLSAPESIECSSSSVLTSSTTSTKPVADLSQSRVVSSIPRTESDSNWVYPSESQFYNAMVRKNWSPEKNDMKTVVPLHNMVNEVAWAYILAWEAGKGGEECGGVQLTSFKGDASKVTPRAAINHYVFGRDLPFDRHDWTVDRCGKRVDYVIDFYTTNTQVEGEPKFYLDVRPKLNSMEGVKLRLFRAFGW